MTDERMHVTAPANLIEAVQDPVFVSEDWALPRVFEVEAKLKSGVRVEISVEVTRTKAWARRVCVESDSPQGVGSATLRKVPVRNAMATGCVLRLLRVNRQADGTFALMPNDVGEQDMTVVGPLIEGLIGYERLRAEEVAP